MRHGNGIPRSNGHAGTRAGGRRWAPIRFAVVGAGHIAQNAVLPAFRNARPDCELTALVSGNPRKRAFLSSRYGIEHSVDYENFDRACRAGIFDAVYIALPNSMHREFTERAAAAGIHVLCEKPMAMSSGDCRAMIAACRAADVRLMIAYRLHFEKANLKAAEIVRSGKIGDPRFFSSVFSMQVKPGNIRLDGAMGGGPLWDIGIYCINAARYLMRENPVEVIAASASRRDRRFSEVDEAVSAIMRFPDDRLASFTCSFGAADTASYRIVGTKGDLVVEPAYEYEEALEHCLTIDGRLREQSFSRRDQFAPELIYFARCVREGIDPEPGGPEGLIDTIIIEAIEESARTGRSVRMGKLPEDTYPDQRQEQRKRPPRKEPLILAEAAHAD